MGFKRTFAKSVLISGGYSYLSQGISFFSTVIISRFLGPESYGFVGIITIFTGFLSIFSDSGISLAVIRSDYKYTYYKSLNSLGMIIGICLCITLSLLSYPLSLYFKNPALVLPIVVMSVSFIIKSMTMVSAALLAKEMKFAFLGRSSLITGVIGILMTIGLAYAGAGYWALIIPQVSTGIFYFFIIEHYYPFGLKIYSWAHIKVAYRHTRKTIGNLLGFYMVNYWARNSDNLIVGRYYGVHDLGIYARAYNFLTLPLSLITGLIGNVLYPSLNKIRDSVTEMKKQYLFVLKMIMLLSYPVSFGLVLFPQEIVQFLWGKKWLEVAPILPYFGLLVFSQSLLSTVGNILVLFKREEVFRISGWVGALVMISAIALGALHSLLTIAQYYSFAFIAIVLPFNVGYIYIKTLGFSIRSMLLFWSPVVLLSVVVWFGCRYNLLLLRALGLGLLFVFIIITVFAELKTLIGRKPVLVPA